MPQVLFQDGFAIYIYPNDHGPAHAHVFQGGKPGPEMEIELETLAVLLNRMKAADARKARRLVREQQEWLLSEWNRIKPRLNQF